MLSKFYIYLVVLLFSLGSLSPSSWSMMGDGDEPFDSSGGFKSGPSPFPSLSEEEDEEIPMCSSLSASQGEEDEMEVETTSSSSGTGYESEGSDEEEITALLSQIGLEENIDRWINGEINRCLVAWAEAGDKLTGFEAIIEAVKSFKENYLTHFEDRFNTEGSTDLEIEFGYNGHTCSWEEPWEPLQGDPSFDESQDEIQGLLGELYEDYLEEKGIDHSSVTEDEYKEEHLGGIQEAFEEAVEAAIEQEWDDNLEDLALEIQQEIVEAIVQNTDCSRLGLNPEELESILTLATNMIDQSDPIGAYLKNIMEGLNAGLVTLRKDLLKRHRDELSRRSLNFVQTSDPLTQVRERLRKAIKDEDYLDEHRMRVLCGRIIRRIVVEALRSQLEDYVKHADDYSGVIKVFDNERPIEFISAKKAFADIPLNCSIEEYHKWLEEVENFYKVFPEEMSARTLTYRSRNPSKPATEPINLGPIFAAMREKGRKVHEAFACYLYREKKRQELEGLRKSRLKLEKEREKLTESLEKLEKNQEEIQKKIDQDSTNLPEVEQKKLEVKIKIQEKQQRTKEQLKTLESKLAKLPDKIQQAEQECQKYEEPLREEDLQAASSREPTNILVPTLLFCVSARPSPGTSTGSSRRFIRVDLTNDLYPYLISTDREDGIYADFEEQARRAMAEDEQFLQSLGTRSSLYTWPPYTREGGSASSSPNIKDPRGITGHSERVLTQALRTPEFIAHIVQCLKEELEREGYTLEGDPYKVKVYGVTLLCHSTKIVCHQCVRAFVAQQAVREEGSFISLLTQALQEDGFFEAYKHGESTKDKKVRERVKVATVVVSDQPYDEAQSKLVRDMPTTKVALRDNEIDLKTHNPLAMIELYRPELPPYEGESAWVHGPLMASGSLGARFANIEGIDKDPEIKKGNFPSPVKTRKKSFSDEIKSLFASEEGAEGPSSSRKRKRISSEEKQGNSDQPTSSRYQLARQTGYSIPEGMTIVPMPLDGHCMYRAILAGIERLHGGVGYTLHDLRNTVANEIRENTDAQNILAQIITILREGNLNGLGEGLLRTRLFQLMQERGLRIDQGDHPDEVDILMFNSLMNLGPREGERSVVELYIEGVQNSSVWGGDLELGILSRLLGVQIIVHRDNGTIDAPIGDPAALIVRLAYNDTHYHLIAPGSPTLRATRESDIASPTPMEQDLAGDGVEEPTTTEGDEQPAPREEEDRPGTAFFTTPSAPPMPSFEALIRQAEEGISRRTSSKGKEPIEPRKR